MMIVDREPTANIVAIPSSQEGLSVNTISSEIPQTFSKAFEGEPINNLDPGITLIGRNRFYSKLSLGFRKKGKDFLDRLKRGGRSRRCGNCRERHSSYEKCQESGLLRVDRFKPASILSGFR